MPARVGGFVPFSDLDLVPPRRLEARPIVESIDAVECDLAEIAYLDSREQTIDAAVDQLKRSKEAQARELKHTEVDGERMTFAERRARLFEAVFRYADAHPEIFPAGSKTLKLVNGKLSYRATPRVLGAAERKTAADVLAAIEERSGIKGKVQKLLARAVPKLFKRPADRFVRAKLELAVSSIKE